MRLVVPSACGRARRGSPRAGRRCRLDALAAGQLGVVRLGAPVEAAAGRVRGAGQGGAEHDGVRAARDRLDDVARARHAAVGDDVHVAAAGLVHVVAAGRRDVGDRGRHRRVDAEGGAGGVGRAAAEADEHARRAGAHEVQRRRVGRAAADDHRHVELVDELLEVERLGPAGDVLGGDGRAADDEQVDPGVHDGLPELLGALRASARRRRSPRRADLARPARRSGRA